MNKNIIVIALMLCCVNVNADEWTGNVNFFLGQKTLDTDDWEPLDKQPEFGILVDFKKQDWPVSIAIDFLGSADSDTIEGVSFDVTTSELNLGVRKIWSNTNTSIRPYIGGGLAFIGAEIKATAFNSVTVSDNSTGLWIGGGIYWTLGQSFNLGLDLRYSQADVTLFDTTTKAGGTHAGIMLGYHW